MSSGLVEHLDVAIRLVGGASEHNKEKQEKETRGKTVAVAAGVVGVLIAAAAAVGVYLLLF